MLRTIAILLPRALFSTLALVAMHSAAQETSTISIANSTRLRMQDLGSSQGHLLVSEHRFGFDSSWVDLIRLNPNGSATPLTAQRFGDPLWFLFDAADGDGGVVVSGALANSYVPQLVRYANDGTFTWTKSFAGMQFSQTRFGLLLSDGFSTVTGYTNADGFGGNGLYRASCDPATGNATEIVQVTTAEDLFFMFNCGVTYGAKHVLGGSGLLPGSTDHKALLGAFDSNGALWLKQYQLGSAEPQSEEVIGIALFDNDVYACAMNSVGPDGLSRGHFIIVDGAGVPLYGLLLTGAEDVHLTAVHRLQSGTFMVAGSSGTSGLLLKLGLSNELVWSKRCSTCLNAPINSFYESSSGTFGLGPGQIQNVIFNNNVCGYEPISTISATSYLPPYNDITPVNDNAPPVTVGTIALLPRPAAASASVICGEVGIGEDPADARALVSPNPFTDELFITSGILPGDRVIVRDAQGRAVHVCTYGDGVQLGHLDAGLYLIELGRFRLKAIKD